MITTHDKDDNTIARLLRETLTNLFDINDLRSLSFDTGIAQNEISDQNGKTRVVHEMVGYAQRRDMLDVIWNYVATHRANAGFAMWDGSQPIPVVLVEKPVVEDPSAKLNDLLRQIALLVAEAQLEVARLKVGSN